MKDNIGILKTDISWIKETLICMKEKLENLPCASHTEKITNICSNIENEKRDANNRMYIAIGITAAVIAGVEILLRLLKII